MDLLVLLTPLDVGFNFLHPLSESVLSERFSFSFTAKEKCFKLFLLLGQLLFHKGLSSLLDFCLKNWKVCGVLGFFCWFFRLKFLCLYCIRILCLYCIKINIPELCKFIYPFLVFCVLNFCCQSPGSTWNFLSGSQICKEFFIESHIQSLASDCGANKFDLLTDKEFHKVSPIQILE